MPIQSDDDLDERRESMIDILASWDLDGALPDEAAMELIRDYVNGALDLDDLITKMASLPL